MQNFNQQMEETNTFSVKVYAKEYYDRIIEEIKSLDTSNISPEQIYSAILKKFDGLQITVNIIPANTSIPIYRVTTYEPEGKSLQSPSSFSYNPNPTELGRANLPNEHVFYGALHPYTCLKEMKDKLSSNYYLSEWEYTPKKDFNIALFNAHVNMSEDTIASVISKGYETGVRSMFKESINPEIVDQYWYAIKSFSKLFTEPDSKYYPITAAISSNWLYKLKNKGIDIGMLMYPSVTSQNKEINLAIRKDIADSEEFKLKAVTKFHVSPQNFLGDKTVIQERGFNDSANLITWKKPQYSLAKVDLDNYQIHTQCGCAITDQQRSKAIFNLGSHDFKPLKAASKFLKDEIQKTLTNGFRIGLKDTKNIFQSNNEIDLKLLIELSNTMVKINDDEHIVKYLSFNITAKTSFV